MIRLEKVSKKLADFSIHEIDLEIRQGEYFVIMGPSGAGKTLLLEMIAGLVKSDSGNVTGVDSRSMGFIYQDYMLFPHLNVFANIAFGLRIRGKGKEEIGKQVRELALELHVQHLLRRDVRTLSGGEKQRVAIARALAIHPRLLILDEPTAALDRANRIRTRKMFMELHRRTGATFIQVTHDFEEALSLADRVALMMNGELIQTGRPDLVLGSPASREVADFMGYRNLFCGPVRDGRMRVGNTLDLEVPLGDSEFAYAALRSDDVLISRTQLDSSARNRLRGRITTIMQHASLVEVVVDVDGVEFSVDITRKSRDEMELKPEDPVILTFKVSSVRCFEH